MELQLGLALPTPPPFDTNGSCSSSSSSSGGGGGTKKRRCFDAESRVGVVPKTLHLLVWNTDRSDDGDEPRDLDDNSFSSVVLNEEEGLVGWPPVKAWRKKPRRHNGRPNNNRTAAPMNSCGGCRASNSTYVKVKLEGNAIARKIDLSVHHSFESLTATLMTMFDISDEHQQKSFKLAYQDRDGDWLLAEDVPWRTFIRSLKCIKLIRSRSC
ncbi:hypothetical protein GQ457_18G003620 [Hibiscus cannabinus]